MLGITLDCFVLIHSQSPLPFSLTLPKVCPLSLQPGFSYKGLPSVSTAWIFPERQCKWSNIGCGASQAAQQWTVYPPIQEGQKAWIWPLGQENPMQEEMKSVPVFLPGKFHGQRSLVGRTPRGCKESGTTECVHAHTHTHTHTHITWSLSSLAAFTWQNIFEIHSRFLMYR